jgi:serine/threonine protein kinase
VEKQKHSLIQAINNAGILHNDLYDRNFLVDKNYNICLIDFDQAQPAEGKNDYDHGYFHRVPRPVIMDRNECVDKDCLSILDRAWDIAARSNASYPGKYMAYYSLDIEGKKFPGERPWEKRWEYIGKALRDACGGNLKGKKVLELGCNLSLLSIWAAREGAVCNGYEYAADILEGSRLAAQAFGVAEQCSWQQADFNKKEVTDRIGDDYDVCTCLSVMNWVNNKENLINLLSRQKVVLYEGHDSDEVEMSRLRQAGFANIQKVAQSERKRSVFAATRA